MVLTYALEIFLVVLITVIIDFLNTKRKEGESQLAKKYIDMITQTVSSCVVATNQTYVDSLKNKEIFTKEAQIEAFNRTLEAIKTILNKDAIKYLSAFTGDIEKYLTTLIEAEVAVKKHEKGSQ